MSDRDGRAQRGPQTERRGPEKALSHHLSELWELVKGYLRQETLDPIKGLGRYVALGVVGALMLGIGFVLVTVGALRILQTETDVFDENLSWVPYLIVFAASVLGGVLALRGTSRRTGKEAS